MFAKIKQINFHLIKDIFESLKTTRILIIRKKQQKGVIIF